MKAKNYAGALEIHNEIYPVIRQLFIETNPAPIKYLAWKLGFIHSPELRLPLTQLNDHSKEVLDHLFEENYEKMKILF